MISPQRGLIFLVDDDPHLSALVAELLRASPEALLTTTWYVPASASVTLVSVRVAAVAPEIVLPLTSQR